MLGRHLAEAGDANRAVPYLCTAARNASATFANEEAARLAREGIALLDDGRAGVSDRAMIELTRIEGAAMRSLARYDEAVGAYRRLLDLLPDENRLEHARVRSIIGQVLADWHHYEDALAELEVARQTVGEPPATPEFFDVWLAVLGATSSVLYWLADHERHSELLRRAEPVVEKYASSQEERLAFYDVVRNAMLRRDGFLVSDELARIDLILYEARRGSDDEETRAWASFMHGFTLLWRRDLAAAEPLLRASLTAAERLGSAMLRSRALTYLMVCARLRGDVTTAAGLVDPVRQAAREGDLEEYEAVASATAAWIAFRQGDEDAVQTEGVRALEIWTALPNRYPFDWMAGFPLLAVAVRHRDAPAASHWTDLVLAERQQALPDLITTPLRDGRVAFTAGRRADALAAFDVGVRHAVDLHYL
jgi:tetratricopeptide (TPR) repeat protein